MIIYFTIYFVIVWVQFWIWFRDVIWPRFNWRKWLNWRFGLCFFIAWFILHAPIYVMIIFGNPTVRTIGLSIYGVLWLPWMNESIIQIPIAIWLFKRLFPKFSHNADEFK